MIVSYISGLKDPKICPYVIKRECDLSIIKTTNAISSICNNDNCCEGKCDNNSYIYHYENGHYVPIISVPNNLNFAELKINDRPKGIYGNRLPIFYGLHNGSFAPPGNYETGIYKWNGDFSGIWVNIAPGEFYYNYPNMPIPTKFKIIDFSVDNSGKIFALYEGNTDYPSTNDNQNSKIFDYLLRGPDKSRALRINLPNKSRALHSNLPEASSTNDNHNSNRSEYGRNSGFASILQKIWIIVEVVDRNDDVKNNFRYSDEITMITTNESKLISHNTNPSLLIQNYKGILYGVQSMSDINGNIVPLENIKSIDINGDKFILNDGIMNYMVQSNVTNIIGESASAGFAGNNIYYCDVNADGNINNISYSSNEYINQPCNIPNSINHNILDYGIFSGKQLQTAMLIEEIKLDHSKIINLYWNMDCNHENIIRIHDKYNYDTKLALGNSGLYIYHNKRCCPISD